ncbi:MAG: hypothetical protein JSS27_08860 [Planctomycetes bacterium]|nr:hypothetical protein [Planctomycetota bacterium]
MRKNLAVSRQLACATNDRPDRQFSGQFRPAGNRGRLSLIVLMMTITLSAVTAEAQYRAPLSSRVRQWEERAAATDQITEDLAQQLERLDRSLRELQRIRAELSSLRLDVASRTDAALIASLEQRIAILEASLASTDVHPQAAKPGINSGRFGCGNGAQFEVIDEGDGLYVSYVGGGNISWASGRLEKHGDGAYRGTLSGVFTDDHSRKVRMLHVTVRPINNASLSLTTPVVHWNNHGVETERAPITVVLRR